MLRKTDPVLKIFLGYPSYFLNPPLCQLHRLRLEGIRMFNGAEAMWSSVRVLN